jgi:hypothetical protein
MCSKHYARWRRTIAPGEEMPPKPPRSPVPVHPAFIDRTGKRYGRLVVVRLGEKRQIGTKWLTCWLCRCDCGNELEVYLGGSDRTSCGCGRRKSGPATGGYARNQVLKSYRAGARKRGLCWELTEDDFDRLTAQACFYCGSQPTAVARRKASRFTYNGLDRKDNDLGYTVENVVPCCKACNVAKMDRPYDDFMAWIARLTEYHWFHPDVMPSRLLREVKEPA